MSLRCVLVSYPSSFLPGGDRLAWEGGAPCRLVDVVFGPKLEQPGFGVEPAGTLPSVNEDPQVVKACQLLQRVSGVAVHILRQ